MKQGLQKKHTELFKYANVLVARQLINIGRKLELEYKIPASEQNQLWLLIEQQRHRSLKKKNLQETLEVEFYGPYSSAINLNNRLLI